jgi:DNA-binding MarR family transcriptional regulator
MNHVTLSEVLRLVTAIASVASRLGLSFSAVVDRVESAPESLLSGSGRGGESSREMARALLRARGRRAEVFGIDLFRDPAWDILLDLYVHAGESGALMISALCHSSCVPPTTALRYVHKLVKAGILLSEDDTQDQRRTMVRLAPHVSERMDQVLTILRDGR